MTDESKDEYEEQKRMIEPVDFFEKDDDVENVDKETAEETLGDKIKRFMGLGEKDKYDNTYTYVKDHVTKNGPLGAFLGFVVATVSVIVHVMQVVLKNIIGEPAHFDLKEAIERAKADLARELNEETKQKKKEVRGQKREERQTEKSSHKEGITQENAEAKKTKENPDLSEHLEPGSKSKNYQQYKEYKKTYMDNIMIQNKMVEGVLNCRNMQECQRNFNIVMKNDPNSDRVYFFQKDKINDLTNLPYITKQNLIKGNANSISEIFYDKEAKSAGGLEASAKAVLLGSKIKNEIFSCAYADMREESSETKDYCVMLSSAIVESEDHSVGTLMAILSSVNESVDLIYKDEYIGTVDLTEPFENNIEGICNGMKEIDERAEKEVYNIGQDLTFFKVDPDTVKINANGIEKEFTLRNQEHLNSILDFIQENSSSKSEQECQMEALIIGGKMYPYMEPMKSEEDGPLNPFTGETVKDGDFILMQRDGFPMITQYQINSSRIESGTSRISGYTEDHVILAQIPLGGEKTDLNMVKEDAMTRLSEARKAELIGIDQKLNINEVSQSVYDQIHTADARLFFQAIKKDDVFRDERFDDIEVVELDDESIDEDYESDGSDLGRMFREAEAEQRRQREMGEDLDL